MFKSDWCKPVIAGLAILSFATGIAGYILGFQLGEEYGNAEYSADYHEKYATDKIERECLGSDPSGRELHDCIEHQVVTSYEHHTAYTDLAAQTRMANWAMVVGVFTGITVLVTAAGVAYVALTLGETRRAVKAADDAVTVTRDIGEAQVRPWVIPDGVPCSFSRQVDLDDGARPSDGVGFRVSWKNTGQTPAINVNVSCRFEMVKFGEKVPIFSAPERLGQVTIGSGITVHTSAMGINAKTYASLMARETQLIVHSRIDYSDPFGSGKNWHSQCVVRGTFDGQTGDNPEGENYNMNFSPEGEQNTLS